MKKIIPFGLTLIIFIGSAGMSAGADFQKGAAAQRGDYATALREWKPLAEQGYAAAQFNLGQIYGFGHGVPKDDKEAVKWYRLAAEQGNASAQNNLGAMYFRGSGVRKDNVFAHMWLNIAASSWVKGAAKNRSIVEKRMTPLQLKKAYNLALECVRKKYKDC